MTVVLIGPPAAGKSRTGRRLARLLDASFADTDRLIQVEHGPIRDLFAERGEEAFRELEAEAVARAVREREIVSLGGGAVMHPSTQELLLGEGIWVVHLTVRADAVAERIANDKRPLIRSVDDWRALVERRRPTYERLASLTVDTSFRPMRHVVDEMLEGLVKAGAVTRPASLDEPDAEERDDDVDLELELEEEGAGQAAPAQQTIPEPHEERQ